MPTTVVQDTKNSNGLAQTFSNTYSSTPTEGNLLVAYLWHDESSTDVATLTSSGWTRMATVSTTLAGFVYRISIYAKFAGASESTTVGWDLGEVNRRAHGYAAEYSGSGVTQLNAEDSASSETDDNGGTAATSSSIGTALTIETGQLAVAMVGLNGTSTTAPTWSVDITGHENWSNNFRASAVGTADAPGDIQPTASWGTNRNFLHAVFALGTPPAGSTVKIGSTFRALKVAA